MIVFAVSMSCEAPWSPDSSPFSSPSIKRKLPDWIELAVYEFIDSGNYRLQTLKDLSRSKNFASWHDANVAESDGMQSETGLIT